MTKSNAEDGGSGRVSLDGGPSSTRAKRRRRSHYRESTIAIIDRLLANKVPITINGETMQVPAFKAIILQLLQKAVSGNRRALRALLRYKKFANRGAGKAREITFTDSEYTAAFADSLRKAEHD